MADKSVQVVNKPEFLEVTDGEVLIFIATIIPIELSSASSVLLKTPTMEHLDQITQDRIDLLKQELKKNVTANNDFKNFINK